MLKLEAKARTMEGEKPKSGAKRKLDTEPVSDTFAKKPFQGGRPSKDWKRHVEG